MYSRLLLAAISLLLLAQDVQQQWNHSQVNDPLHQTSFEEYRLKGKFLVGPRRGSLESPELVLRCLPGRRMRGKVHGSFVDGYVNVGATVDTRVDGRGIAYVPVEIKLDDRKLQNDSWTPSTDHQAVYLSKLPFCGDCTLANMLYGHTLPHKENSSPQIRRVMLGVDEHLAAEVEMEFDLPDVTEVADTCGVIIHR